MIELGDRVYLAVREYGDVELSTEREANNDRLKRHQVHSSHYLYPMDSPNRGGQTLCGIINTFWRGTGSQNEIDKARGMPLCIDCQKHV